MSVSLVKKSLDLVSTENYISADNKSTDPIREIKFKHKSKKKVSVDDKKNALVLVQKLREKSKANNNVDKVEVNVQKLLLLSKVSKVHTQKEKKLLRRIAKNKRECPDTNVEQKSAFSEEDFNKFENEYFAN